MNKAQHPCGVLFLDKPQGWTSRKAVNHVMRVLATSGQNNRKQRLKAGHAGTLDPLATGMLPILLGDATRFSGLGLNAEKSYEVSFDLSFQTDTLDSEGKVVEKFDNIQVSQAQLEDALTLFEGSIQQMPPAYSAIRVDGQRAYALARQGEKVHLQARTVEIRHIKLLNFEGHMVTLAVDCSKGTYIRALARDIGLALGVGGCVTALRRISSGGWPAEMMVSLAELEEKKEACILPLQIWLRDLPQVRLSQDEARRFVLGQRLRWECGMDDKVLCCVNFDDMVLGTAWFQPSIRVLQPERVLPTAQEKMAWIAKV